jgi:cytochrome b561
MLRNTDHEWGVIAKSFHWLIALLLFGQLALGWIAKDMRVSPDKFELFVWHKSIGISILLIVALRIVWRFRNPPPASIGEVTLWQARLAQGAHALLYILMIAVPLSGWWISDTSRIPFRLYWQIPLPDLLPASKDMSELAASTHEVLTTLLIVIVVLHILAAARHHFLLRDDTLTRMLPFGRRSGL